MSTTSDMNMSFSPKGEIAQFPSEPNDRSVPLLPHDESYPAVMKWTETTEEDEVNERLQKCWKEIKIMELGLKPEPELISRARFRWCQTQPARRTKARLRWESRVPVL